MRMRRGHVVELLVVFALVVLAAPMNAQPDSWGMCRDGTVAQPIHAGEFLMLGDPRVEDWATRWRSFKSANPHLRLENDRISFAENDTRIPFRNDTSLCGVSAAGYTIRSTPPEAPPIQKISNTFDDLASRSWQWWLSISVAAIFIAMIVEVSWRLISVAIERSRTPSR